jgi:uncharacterized protein DUF5989
MNGDVALPLAIVGVLLLEATNYLLGNNKLVLAQAWNFLAQHKRWWLAPIGVVVALLGLLLALTTSPAGARFIYTLF